ncbi:glycosyltransferase family 2 protein [Pontibacter cellulosilyticus]|uniref:Glycosyltransferase family 2 protein n=1 Tax=Pontibacter cellulosilyticus TaxID=1720253 RepID=A0A923SHJ5_9BACT|nr:glycosyltransferase family A protein [Pontibacter cellulosilyticus]MBC5991612.1 glycosyltransferase family 2 protein [Pontibacter cellulosilyticus]
MKVKPLISVLMTSYNREEYIGEAIESVLASTYENFELIVVDDKSNDGTVQTAKTYAAIDNRVKVFENEVNLGDYPNRNKAATFATGKYIKYLDSDDIIYPHGLEVMVSCMERFPSAGFGLSSKGEVKKPYPVLLSSAEAYREHFSGFGHFDRAPGSSIIRLDAFNSVGGFSGKRMIGDNELWFILARNFPMVKFTRDLVWDRVHSGQESKTVYARKYDQLRHAVIYEALTHKACPLDEKLRSDILRRLRTAKLKRLVKRIFKL